MTRQTPDGRDSLSVFCPKKNDLYQKIGDITTKSINLLVFSFSHPPIRPSCSPPCCTPPRASRPQLPARSRAAARPPDMVMVKLGELALIFYHPTWFLKVSESYNILQLSLYLYLYLYIDIPKYIYIYVVCVCV